MIKKVGTIIKCRSDRWQARVCDTTNYLPDLSDFFRRDIYTRSGGTFLKWLILRSNAAFHESCEEFFFYCRKLLVGKFAVVGFIRSFKFLNFSNLIQWTIIDKSEKPNVESVSLANGRINLLLMGSNHIQYESLILEKRDHKFRRQWKFMPRCWINAL